ncbi:AMP-binding protein, partial [Actinoplanes rectilineatus]|uniref:AMP-binding protein n=1 Tax=Actinoplanes rectilineatus TaxID=113571 RepID=UPI002480A3AA
MWCLFHSYAFDFSVWEMYGALLHGGRLEIVGDRVRRNPADFAEFLVKRGVTVLNQTPSAFRQLLGVLTPQQAARLKVREVVFGGEALPFGSTRRWYELMGDRARLVNMYGITETTVHVTFQELTPSSVEE